MSDTGSAATFDKLLKEVLDLEDDEIAVLKQLKFRKLSRINNVSQSDLDKALDCNDISFAI